ncbi:MAG: hypothetical protein ACK2U5_09475, partial [Candidatus Promineifilaceae bacterium]
GCDFGANTEDNRAAQSQTAFRRPACKMAASIACNEGGLKESNGLLTISRTGFIMLYDVFAGLIA